MHSADCRSCTEAARLKAVERVVGVLRERFAEQLSLDEMARIAISSPFHFNRVFRQVTGLPPGRFLAAVRLDAAKRLLVTTHFSVTAICYAVGYNSLGTFTTHFTQFVGMSPSRLRRLLTGERTKCTRSPELPAFTPAAPGATVQGWIRGLADFKGRAMVGAFGTPVPRGRPASCSAVEVPGVYELRGIPDGRWYILAIGLDREKELDMEAAGQSLPRGIAGAITVRNGAICAGAGDVTLREPRVTDPPVLISLQVLIAERERQLEHVSCDVESKDPHAHRRVT